MEEIEVYSWFFVYREWDKLQRMPVPDKGFEDSFRKYIYEKIKPDVMSGMRDMGFGLSYTSLSTVPHELDVICSKEREKSVFELKHYCEERVTKDMVFIFLGKVIDFYLRNAALLSDYKITMLFVTVNRNVDESMRKLCIAYGIKLIEPSLMTLGVLDHCAVDLYGRIPEDSPLKSETAGLLERIRTLRELCDYSFSDVFRYKSGKIEVRQEPILIDIDKALRETKQCHDLFKEVLEGWKSKRN